MILAATSSRSINGLLFRRDGSEERKMQNEIRLAGGETHEDRQLFIARAGINQRGNSREMACGREMKLATINGYTSEINPGGVRR